ncbi:MAG: hypothetical protein IIA83_10640, partial [Thaumarchaeota archaeon]|nr:hypothetical protein [Nitrososphaerota archaeon]
RGSVRKHEELSPVRNESQSQYNLRRKLFFFDLWLKNGRTIELTYWKNSSVDSDGNLIAKKVTEKIKVNNVVQLLELFKKTENKESFQKLFHNYLTDPIHLGKMASSVLVDKSSIESYFTHNYAKVGIQFDPKKKYRVNAQRKGERTSFTLNDLYVLLTDGRPTLMQKTAFMCKFQRGLDNSSFIDGFNFEAYEQLVEYFGTTDFESWDESKCPVPIENVRLKTQFNHIGFLDIDAIKLLKKWLKKREELMGEKIKNGDPIFVNQKGYAVKDTVFTRTIRKLADTAKIGKKLDGYERSNRYEQNSHELRDLLNTTLEAYGAGSYLAEHVIGHKQKSNYTKIEQLYLEKMRNNFSKASKAINIFSKVSNYIHGGDEKLEQLEKKVELLSKTNISLTKQKKQNVELNVDLFKTLLDDPKIKEKILESLLDSGKIKKIE